MHEHMHERLRLNRRQVIGAALGAFALTVAPESATAPEPAQKLPDKEYVGQAEIAELEADLYETADMYGLSLAPQDAIHAAFDELRGAQTGSEAISIVSTFTERHFGFPVNDTTHEGIGLETGMRLQRLVSHLSLLPRELYEAINLEKIDIGVPPLMPPRGGEVAASFTTQESGNTITLSPSYSDVLHLLLHELGHGLDYVSRLSSGGEESRRAADDYLNEGRESEYNAEITAAWLKGDVRRDDLADPERKALLDGYDDVLPGLAVYIERALRPYIHAFANGEKDYFFQPAE